MNYKILGTTGVQVSTLAFGTMSFGGEADEETARKLFYRCRDAGINLFDCADVYQNGLAEEILGRLIADCRDEVVITSKCYFPMSDDVNHRGASRMHVVRSVEGSLKRLGTDRIDVFFIHRFDGSTPLEETLRALDDMVRAGKIVYIGVSNFAAWQTAKALGVSALHGFAPIQCIQPMYNLAKRQAEVEILPMAQSEGLGALVYSPLGGGLLSGKYEATTDGDGRITSWPMYAERYRDAFDTAARFSSFARDRGYGPVPLAVAWAASHPAVTAPLIGARSVNQLEGSLAAVEIDMTPELRAEISALSASPPPATDRSEEGTEAGTWIR